MPCDLCDRNDCQIEIDIAVNMQSCKRLTVYLFAFKSTLSSTKKKPLLKLLNILGRNRNNRRNQRRQRQRYTDLIYTTTPDPYMTDYTTTPAFRDQTFQPPRYGRGRDGIPTYDSPLIPRDSGSRRNRERGRNNGKNRPQYLKQGNKHKDPTATEYQYFDQTPNIKFTKPKQFDEQQFNTKSIKSKHSGGHDAKQLNTNSKFSLSMYCPTNLNIQNND